MSKFSGMGLPVNNPARLNIMHPVTNEPLVDADGKNAYVDLYSADSERARSYNRKSTQKRLDMRGRAVVSAVAMENEQHGLLAELSVGWYLVDLEGCPIDFPFTTQNARELYTDPVMTWLREQVDAFCGARGNFSKPSASGSSNTPSTNSQPSES